MLTRDVYTRERVLVFYFISYVCCLLPVVSTYASSRGSCTFHIIPSVTKNPFKMEFEDIFNFKKGKCTGMQLKHVKLQNTLAIKKSPNLDVGTKRERFVNVSIDLQQHLPN